ncbi:alpha/beta hydrolase [Kaistia dalseonensis]|uniref:Esterase/lipase superfamily enzyme n=1 Tax=Kaistia dalseonensis TaxID=410840 RepID=A0ABU0HEK1_9HYPH|nr:alpha/beta hydrolase [Kaistia dalseonensis]MCX5497531.1 alpha/beta hydrolase [Kaistia dalseonensis]MDQ0440170.1 esterase/lipase superfamily enzyme [Kaistia dalseonensis]
MVALLAAATLLSACASRPESGFLIPVAMSEPGGRDVTMLVATTREADARPGTYFNGERSDVLSFASMKVSIPPNHKAGEIEWPSSPPGNPEKSFVVRDAELFDSDKAFVDRLNAQIDKRPRGSRSVLIFVHGYNTMFAEAIFRFAQIDHDSRTPDVPVLFTWASRGKVAGYVYDLNSATAARDDLERTIRLVFASHAESVDILAHSMGNWVAVEALRQIKISGKLANPQKLGWVILAAPDIDMDVFKSQMRRFGKLQQPFFVVLSKDDNALGFSKLIAGDRERLGSNSDENELAALGATVIDLSDMKALDASNHGKFAQLAEAAPELLPILREGISDEALSHGSESGKVATTVQGVVTLPLTVLGAPIRIIKSQ